MSTFSVLLLGATGETGKEVFKHLLNNGNVSKIILVSRRKIDSVDDPRVEQRLINFDDLSSHADAFKQAEIAYCCLGTNRAKMDKGGYAKVDLDYVVGAAKLLKAAGCRDFHLVTAKGASAGSFFQYPQVKGKCEEAVKALGFERTSVYRPALLMCDRQEQGGLERATKWLAGKVDRGSSFSVSTDALGRVIVENSLRRMREAGEKTETLEHADIVKLASSG